jgi:Leucine-rich repeat (LRR) protein
MVYQNLRKLDLSHKGLTEVPIDILAIKNLHVLDLSYNELTSFPDFLLELPHLRTLAIGHNAITSLPLNIASSSIKDLIADYNHIEFILPSTLIRLRKLILSYNRLNVGIVRTILPNLHHLDIRCNPSIQFAGPECLPNIHRYYHDTDVHGALVPDGMQYYSK